MSTTRSKLTVAAVVLAALSATPSEAAKPGEMTACALEKSFPARTIFFDFEKRALAAYGPTFVTKTDIPEIWFELTLRDTVHGQVYGRRMAWEVAAQAVQDIYPCFLLHPEWPRNASFVQRIFTVNPEAEATTDAVPHIPTPEKTEEEEPVPKPVQRGSNWSFR